MGKRKDFVRKEHARPRGFLSRRILTLFSRDFQSPKNFLYRALHKLRQSFQPLCRWSSWILETGATWTTGSVAFNSGSCTRGSRPSPGDPACCPNAVISLYTMTQKEVDRHQVRGSCGAERTGLEAGWHPGALTLDLSCGVWHLFFMLPSQPLSWLCTWRERGAGGGGGKCGLSRRCYPLWMSSGEGRGE